MPSGETIHAERLILDPVEDPVVSAGTEAGSLHWFDTSGAAPACLPLNFNPSSADARLASVVEKCRIGERIPVASGADMSILGTAIHACIALSFTDRRAPLTEAEVGCVLSGFGVTEYLSPSAVSRQVTAFHDWLESRWAGAKPHAEIAVQSVLASGQVLNGRIDLLLETEKGWILIDHKSSPLAPDRWEQLADEYGVQMDAYAKAVEQGSGRKVLERWLFLPVAAGGISIATI